MSDFKYIKSSDDKSVRIWFAIVLGLLASLVAWYLIFFDMVLSSNTIPDMISPTATSLSTGIVLASLYIGASTQHMNSWVTAVSKLDRDLIIPKQVMRWLKAKQVYLLTNGAIFFVLSGCAYLSINALVLSEQAMVNGNQFKIGAIALSLIAYLGFFVKSLVASNKRITAVTDGLRLGASDELMEDYTPFDRSKTNLLSYDQIKYKADLLALRSRNRQSLSKTLKQEMMDAGQKIEEHNVVINQTLASGLKNSSSEYDAAASNAIKVDVDLSFDFAETATRIAKHKKSQAEILNDLEYLLRAMKDRVNIMEAKKKKW